MTKIPLFLRPLTSLIEEEEAAEIAEMVRLVEAAMDATSAPESDPRKRDRRRELIKSSMSSKWRK